MQNQAVNTSATSSERHFLSPTQQRSARSSNTQNQAVNTSATSSVRNSLSSKQQADGKKKSATGEAQGPPAKMKSLSLPNLLLPARRQMPPRRVKRHA